MTESVITDQDIDLTRYLPSDEDGLGSSRPLSWRVWNRVRMWFIVCPWAGIQDVFKAIIAREYLATVKKQSEYGDAVFDIISRHQRGKTGPADHGETPGIYHGYLEELFEDAY